LSSFLEIVLHYHLIYSYPQAPATRSLSTASHRSTKGSPTILSTSSQCLLASHVER
jgi:hypothetical protein